ncbi:PAS domain S-box-containing protein [Cohaesibacter marisflavi]|uniref:histidine kinase n=1 Tax=Cohaesibacter marisflavi TaxID=655353 RepID=A0A1I5DE90_9HYPH|nr:ATP-binding protein [Cohaesibacter marisflavi]SFN97437.1 PAS domain S-box-containing protein [Cohaesibacter marisflavi]
MPSFQPASLASPYLTLSAHPTIGAVLLDSRPAWVWNDEGNRILWANAAGLAFFGETSMDSLLERSFGDVHPARRHLARLARNARPDSPTLDTLRFFLGLSFVTLSCLCKKIKVEGETVLLVLSSEPLDAIEAPDQTPDWPENADPKTSLLSALSCDGTLHSALLDDHGKVIAASDGFVPFGNNAVALDKLLAKLADDARYAEGSLPFFDSQTSAAVARISDEPDIGYLLLVHNPAIAVDNAPTGSDNPFAELEDDNQDEIERALAEEEADIFEDPFGINELSELEERLIKGPDRLKDRDLQPFLTDEGRPYSSLPFTDPVTGRELSREDLIKDGKDRPTSEASITVLDSHLRQKQQAKDDNVYRLQFPQRGNGSSDQSALNGMSDDFHAKGAYHFVWESDETGRFKFVSEELANGVGPRNADIGGLTWSDVAARFEMDEDGAVASGFDSRDTWASLDVWWPVADKPYRIAVELTGLPIYGHLHGFQGFRGFGLCKPDERQDMPGSLAHQGALDADQTKPEDQTQDTEQERSESHGLQLQIAQIEELISADLLKAAQNAVASTTELISPETAGDRGQSPQDTDETSGVIAVCDDSKKGTEDQSYENNNNNQSEPENPSVEASQPNEDTETIAHKQTFELVGSLLSGNPDGVKETTQDASIKEETAREAKLSAGEEHAFQEIAEALSDESFESRLPAEDLDDDYEEFEAFGEEELEDEEESDALKAAPQASIFPTDEIVQQIASEVEKADREAAPSKPVETSDAAEDKPARPTITRRPLAALIKKRLKNEEEPALPWRSSEGSLGDLLAARERKDDAHKSATSKALLDIFSIDPKLKSLHEQAGLAQQPSQGDTLAEPLKEADVTSDGEAFASEQDASLEQSKPEDSLTPDAAKQLDASQEDISQAWVEDGSQDVDNALQDDPFEEPVVSSSHFVISASGDDEDSLPEPPALPSLGNDIPEDGETPSESSADLTAATVAGVAALSIGTLWDKGDKSSPLIDMLNKLPTAIIVSAQGTVLFASKTALTLLGYESPEALQAMGGMEGLFSGRPGDWLTKTNGRTTLRTEDGSPISVEANISSINWGEQPAAMLCFEETPATPPSVGVSEEDEKIAELEAILDTATDGVLVLDRDGCILRMNHSAEALFEVDRHKVAGERFVSLLADESHKDALAYLERLRNSGLASLLNGGQEVIGQLRSGGLIPLVMTMGRVSIPGTNRFCAVLRDVTDWKRTQEELLTQKLRAEDASKKKSEFLAKVSHEIRTPLNAIIGFSEVMMEERFGSIGQERYKDYLKDIKLSGTHIMSLLNDLLDLSKVEAGKMDLQFEAVGLNGLVAECVGIMQPQANRSQIIIRTSTASRLPDVVADCRSLRQIILNVLSNAVKFNHAGGQVIVSTTEQENGDVVLRIRDTGIGMSKEEMKRALEPFRQISSTTRTAAEGTGLGLPLTKALTEANRARLSISSESDHGTLVEITFPEERVVEPEPENPVEAEPAS